MQFNSLLALALASLSFISAFRKGEDEPGRTVDNKIRTTDNKIRTTDNKIRTVDSSQANEDLKHKPHHHHHHRSSSSSSHQNCLKSVLHLQKQVEASLKTGNSLAFRTLAAPSFSYALNNRQCVGPNCCYVTGNAQSFAAQFAPNQHTTFYYVTSDYVHHLRNGTIVVSKFEVAKPAVGSVARYLNFFYNPACLKKCEYQLAYIDGNTLGCPSYQLGLPECAPCS